MVGSHHELQMNGDMCTITFDPTSGQRSYLNLENFHEVVGDIELQTLSSYKARFLTALLNRHVKGSIYGL